MFLYFWKHLIFENLKAEFTLSALEPLTNYNYTRKSIKVIISFNNMFFKARYVKAPIIQLR